MTAASLIAASLLAACGGDDASTDADAPPDARGAGAADDSDDSDRADAPGEGTTADAATAEVVDGEPFPEARCAANREAGTITFLTGFDYAATASAIEMLVADEQGYFEDLCLDVEIKPSFSTSNYPLVAANEAQFASAGSFSEVVAYAGANDAEFAVTEVFGHVPIETLIVKPGMAKTLDDLRGTTIGVKGKLPTGVAAMLAAAGLREGEDYQTVLLEGFDPLAHIAIDEIVGFPGYKSNEPGTLGRADVDFDQFDPADDDIAGSFGVVYTNQRFLKEHPTAAADVVRAALRGMHDAIADPDAAAEIALSQTNRNGSPDFMSPEGERFRWTTDAELIADSTPEGQHLGVPDAATLQREVDQNAEFGLFGSDDTLDVEPFIANGLAADAYADDGTVVWPAER